MPKLSYAWKELKEQLGEDTDSKVRGTALLTGKQGACLDSPAAAGTESPGKGMTPGAGGSRWSRSNQSWKDVTASKGSGRESEAAGTRERIGSFRGQRSGVSNKTNSFQNRGQRRRFN